MVETTQGDEGENPTLAADAAPRPAPVSLVNAFRFPDAHPLILDLMLLQKYGVEWLGWELETLQQRVQEDFKTPTISDVNMEKLQACKALHLVDDFWLRWEVFLPCCSAFNGSFADFQQMQAPEVAECLVAVDIANRIRDDVSWSDEVKTFLAVVHRNSGELVPQAPLEFVTVDTTGYPVDVEDIRKRWPGIRADARAPTGDTIEDEQLRRMLGSWFHLEQTRSKLRSQLHLLQHV